MTPNCTQAVHNIHHRILLQKSITIRVEKEIIRFCW